MKTSVAILAATAALAAVPIARASTLDFDEAMQPILTEYLTITGALAGDELTGVASAAKKIGELAGKLKPGTVTGEHAKHYQHVPMKLKAAAKKVAAAKNIKAAREALKELSKPMAMWATMSKPAGVNVVFCSMAPGSWLQKGKDLRNPYYGAAMLKCGTIVSGPDAEKKPGGHGEGHGGKEGHHHGH